MGHARRLSSRRPCHSLARSRCITTRSRWPGGLGVSLTPLRTTLARRSRRPSTTREHHRDRSATRRSLARIRREIERVVPLRALPIALGLGVVGLLGGMLVLRARGVDLAAGANTSAVATARTEPSTVPPAPALSTTPSLPASVPSSVAQTASTADAGTSLPVLTVVSVASASTTVDVPKQPARAIAPRATAPTPSPVAVPAKKTAKPSDIGFE
jgi:hypothetical protein